MTIAKIGWGLLIVAVLALGALGVVRAPATPDKAAKVTVTEASSPGEFTDRRLAALERRVSSLDAKRFVESNPGGEAERSTPEPVEERSDRVPERERDEDGKLARRAFLQGISDRFETEPLDPRWRQDTERSISSALPTAFDPGVELGEVRCASTICRAVLRHPEVPSAAPVNWLKFANNREGLGQMQVQIDNRHDGTTVLYFMKIEAAAMQ